MGEGEEIDGKCIKADHHTYIEIAPLPKKLWFPARNRKQSVIGADNKCKMHYKSQRIFTEVGINSYGFYITLG